MFKITMHQIVGLNVIRPRESLCLDIDNIFTPVILVTKYTKSMSDSLKSELKLLFPQKRIFLQFSYYFIFNNLFLCNMLIKYKHNVKQL